MMKFIKNISIFIIIGIFLLTTSGFEIFQHVCDVCELSEISIIDKSHDNNCCSSEINLEDEHCCHADENDISSCASEHSHSCCTNEGIYLKINNPFVNSLKSISFTNIFFIIFYFQNTIINDFSFSKLLPFNLSSFIIKYSSKTLPLICKFIL